MLNYSRTTIIDAPVEIVWDFHERTDILDILMPPWQPVEVIRREGGLGVGAETEFRLSILGIPVRWLARHTACEKYVFFTDVQVEGPFDHWTHQHHFDRQGDKTQLTDAIAFSLPLGFLSNALAGWSIQQQLDELFEYRHQVTRHECEYLAHKAHTLHANGR